MRLLVTGGTGIAGEAVVGLALKQGHEVAVLSRKATLEAADGVRAVQGNVTDAATLDRALEGIDAVIDCVNVTTTSRRKASDFFTAAVRSVVRAGANHGLQRYVLLSIVGVDTFPLGYYQAKLAQEKALEGAAEELRVGHTIVRATQFHDFAGQMVKRSRMGPLAFVPDLRVQPVDVSEVAERLLDAAANGPQGHAPELAGPLPEDLLDMSRALVERRGEHVRVLPLPLPPATARANRERRLIPQGGVRGQITFAEWLEKQPATS